MTVNGKGQLLLVSLLVCALGFAYAQSSQVPPTRTQITGRYAIYYHPTNFNQALLLDSAAGSVWELAAGKYKSAISSKETEYRLFQRLGVEGLHRSEIQKLAEQQELSALSEQLQREAEQRQHLSDLPSIEALREIASKSGNQPLIFVSRIRREWPEYKPHSSLDLLRAIKTKYPQLSVEYPHLFEHVYDD